MDMADTIRRLRAYEAAGADVVYAPGLRTIPEVREVVRAVKRPLNVVTGWLDADITLAQLSEAGAKRISVGGALARHAMAGFVKASRATKESRLLRLDVRHDRHGRGAAAAGAGVVDRGTAPVAW